MTEREELEELEELAWLEAREAGQAFDQPRLSDEPGLAEPLFSPIDFLTPGGGIGAAAGGLAGFSASRLARILGGALRGGRWARRGMESAIQSGEMIPAEKAASAVSTAVERGALGGGRLRAAEEALTGPGTEMFEGALEVPIDKIDIIRRLGNKLGGVGGRGVNAPEGRMLTAAAKAGLEEAGTPGAQALLQALSDIAVRKRLAPSLSLWGLLTAQPARALWRANRAVRPNRLLDYGSAGLGAALGGYAGQEPLR